MLDFTKGLDKGYTGGLFELTEDSCTLFTEATAILNKKARQEFLRLYGLLPIATLKSAGSPRL